MRYRHNFLGVVLFTLLYLFFVAFSLYGQESRDSARDRFINRVFEITPGIIHTDENQEQITSWRNEFLDRSMNYERPIVVMIYPRFDYNDAFKFNNSIASIIEAGSQLLYFEARSSDNLTGILQLLLEELPQNQKITLIIGAHGSQMGMRLGFLVGETFEGRNPVEFSVNNLFFCRNLRLLNIDSLVLESCSTGAGGDSNYNFANILSNYTSGTIYAPVIPVDIRTIRYFFDEDGYIERVIFGRGSEDTYIVNGN